MPAKTKLWVALLLCSLGMMFCRASTAADEAPFVYPPLEIHRIESRFVGQSFEICVQAPVSLSDGSERFPVLYLTDGWRGPRFGEETALMQLGGDIPRFISVSIGYPLENPFGAMALRDRDMTPTVVESRVPGQGLNMLIQGIPLVSGEAKTGGADNFLRFIREELQPFINKNYPTIPSDSGYFGHSLGGLFGLYTLFSKPDTFSRYIIGSPSMYWDDEAVLKQAEEFLASGLPINARVSVSIADSEKDKAAQVSRLESMLHARNARGVVFSTHVIPDATHTSVTAANFTRGLQSVYERPKISFVAEYLMKLRASK